MSSPLEQGAHSGPVADLCTLEDGSFISGGLADGCIVVFDNKYELIGMYAWKQFVHWYVTKITKM